MAHDQKGDFQSSDYFRLQIQAQRHKVNVRFDKS